MDVLLIVKIFTAVVWGLIFLLIAIKTFKSVGGAKAFLIILIEALFIAGLIWFSSWAIDRALKEATLTRFNTRFIGEKLAITGCVRNTGKYTLNHVYLNIKVINNATGNVKTESRGRDNTVEWNDVLVAQKLGRGIEKCFKEVFPYPPYFRQVNLQRYLAWD